MRSREEKHHGQFLPEIRRARFERLTIYEVEESELRILERGSADSVYLNIAIALVSIAVTCTVTLFTTTVQSNLTMVIFVVFTVVGYVLGAILLILWWRSRTSMDQCVRIIRERLPPEWSIDAHIAANEYEETE